MSSRFNNDAQTRYSPIEGEAMTMFWVINKADYFILGCEKLYIGTDHKPLLAFFRTNDPKPLDQIVNKRLRKFVSEINELRFTIFHIYGLNNHLSDGGSRFPTGKSGDDKGDGPNGASKVASTVEAMSASTGTREEIQANPKVSWPHTKLPRDAPSDYQSVAQIFAYGAMIPACDADCQDEGLHDYVTQSMLETAALLSISAGKQVSVAKTVDRLIEEIQYDELYKYLCLTISGKVQANKFVGELSVYNYHRDSQS